MAGNNAPSSFGAKLPVEHAPWNKMTPSLGNCLKLGAPNWYRHSSGTVGIDRSIRLRARIARELEDLLQVLTKKKARGTTG